MICLNTRKNQNGLRVAPHGEQGGGEVRSVRRGTVGLGTDSDGPIRVFISMAECQAPLPPTHAQDCGYAGAHDFKRVYVVDANVLLTDQMPNFFDLVAASPSLARPDPFPRGLLVEHRGT